MDEPLAPPASHDASFRHQDDDDELPYARVLRLEEDRRFRNLGAAALVAFLLPVTLSPEGGLYLWHLIPTVSVIEAIRLLAPLILGGALLGLSRAPRLTRLGSGGLALAGLLVCVALFTDSRVAWDGLFSGVVSYVGRQPLPVVVGLTLVGAGAALRGRDGADQAARALLVLGAAALTLLYLLPQRGDVFLVGIVRTTAAAFASESVRWAATGLLYAIFDLFPLAVAVGAVIGLLRARRGGLLGPFARYGLSGLLVLLVYRMLWGGFGFAGALLQVRAALLLGVALGVASHALEAIVSHLLADPLPPGPPRSELARDVRLRTVLTRFLAETPPGEARPVLATPGAPPSHPLLVRLMARRLRELAPDMETGLAVEPTTGQVAPPADPLTLTPEQARAALAHLDPGAPMPATGAPAPGAPATERTPEPVGEPWALRLATGPARLTVALVALAVLSGAGVSWRLARPQLDLTWSLGERTAAGDELFRSLLPRYVLTIGRLDQARADRERTAEAAAVLRDAGRELVAVAREIDRTLAARVEDLVGSAEALDLSGLRWLTAVHAINREVRRLGLPYYVDANAFEHGADAPVRRTFFVKTYTVESIRRFEWDDHRYAALLVRRFDRLSVAGHRLGYVREDEPFALVVLDVIEESVDERLEALAAGECDIAASFFDGFAVEGACYRLLSRLGPVPGADRPAGDSDDGGDGGDALRARYRDMVIDQTARHELQHQIDGDDLPIPAPLYHLVPVASDRSLAIAAAELSAWLCQLDDDDPFSAVWTLAHLSSFVLTDEVWQTPERYAAALVFEALGGAEVVEPMGDLIPGRMSAAWSAVEQRAGAGNARDFAAWTTAIAHEWHERWFGAPCARPEPTSL